MNQKSKLAIIFLFFASLPSCVRSYMVKTETTKAVVEKVNVLAVEYYRPDFVPAKQEDFSHKNRKLECITPAELWKETIQKPDPIKNCLNELQDGYATYFYVPANQPYLELDMEEETNPKCLKESLPKIPLPREIYFLGQELGQTIDDLSLRCFSTSFSTNTNLFMLMENKYLKKKIKIPFPLSRQLKNNQDLMFWLVVNAFVILKSDEKAEGKLLATPVPDDICHSCFKNDALFDDKYSHRLKPVFWP